MDLLNVTVVIKSLGLGGAERLLVDALPYLDRSRFSYRFAYITPWKDTLVPAIRAAGLDVACIGRRNVQPQAVASGAAAYTPARSIRALALLPFSLNRLLHMMRRTRCDLLHADLPISGVVARLAGRRAGVPVVYTEHNLQERYHPATRWANRATFRWNDIVFAVSDEVALSIRRNGLTGPAGSRIDLRTLPNGVPVEGIRAGAADLRELRRELAIPDGHPVVGTVSVFRPQKRLLDWLEVARQVSRFHPDAHFLIVGDGPDMPAIRRCVRDFGMERRVHLTGFREDGRRLIGLMDVYLMTSAFEGLPIAMLEAMALGKPVVATTAGGIPEVVAAGREGLLAGAGDVSLLAAQVGALLDNAHAAARMGASGARKVERDYHTRRRVRTIEAAYRELSGRA